MDRKLAVQYMKITEKTTKLCYTLHAALLHNLFIYTSLAAVTNLASIVNKIIIIIVILNEELKGFYCWFKVLKCFSHTW